MARCEVRVLDPSGGAFRHSAGELFQALGPHGDPIPGIRGDP